MASILEDYEMILSVDTDGFVLMRNGDYGVGLELKLPEIFTIGADGVGAIHDMWQSVIRTMPENCVMHKQDWFDLNLFELDESCTNMIDIAIQKKFYERPYIEHQCFLFFTLSNRDLSNNTRSNFTPFKKNLISNRNLSELVKNDFLSFVNTVVNLINGQSDKGMGTAFLLKDDYFGSDTKLGLRDRYWTLNQNKLLNDIDYTNSDFIKIGRKKSVFYSISSLDQTPNEFAISSDSNNVRYPFSWLYTLGLGLKVPHIVNQIILKPFQDKTLNALNSKRSGMMSFSKASPENAFNAENIGDFQEMVSKEGKTIVRMHLNVQTWADDEKTLNTYSSDVASAFNAKGFNVREERIDNRYLHSACSFLYASEMVSDRTFTVVEDQAAACLIGETNYKSSSSDYGIKFIDRVNRVPIHVDLFEEPFQRTIFNKNFFLVGSSGAGKSVITNELVRNDIASGNHVVIADIGGSYKRHCLMMGDNAVYIEHTDDKPLSFNPFWLESLEDLTQEKKTFILQTIFACGALPLPPLDDEHLTPQVTILRELISSYYKHCFKNAVFPCMNTFYEYVPVYEQEISESEKTRKQAEYVDFYAMKLNFKQFTTGGEFEMLLNAKDDVDLISKPFVVFELQSVKDNKVLFKLVTLMIMSVTLEKLFRLEKKLGKVQDAKISKKLILDEAWKALMNDGMADFIKYAVKTLRKHNGGLGIVTQEPDDILGNLKIANSILGNSDTKIIGDLSSMGAKSGELMDILQLLPHERDLVVSLNRLNLGRDKNREFFIKQGNKCRVYALVLSTQQMALFSTTPQDAIIIDGLVEKYNGNVPLALEHYAYDRENVIA